MTPRKDPPLTEAHRAYLRDFDKRVREATTLNRLHRILDDMVRISCDKRHG